MTEVAELVSPLTGEVLDPDEPNEMIHIVQATDAVIAKHYEMIRKYREPLDVLKRHLADRGKFELPPPRARTATQERLARCPRCSDPLPDRVME